MDGFAEKRKRASTTDFGFLGSLVGDAVVDHGCRGHRFGECEHLSLSNVAASRDEPLGEPGQGRVAGVGIDSTTFYPLGVENCPEAVIGGHTLP